MRVRTYWFALLTVVTLAGAATSSQANEDRSIVHTATDVFLKGSIDGKRLFMVYGMGNALKDNKEIVKWAIKGHDLVDLGHDIYNKDHSGDIVDRVGDGVEISKKAAHHILRQPWKSLQKIPKSYKVNFDRAREAYYGSKNGAVGVLKYSGWAAWANIQGAYYLVVEAPIEFAFFTTVTLAAVPVELAIEGLVIAWDVGKIVVKMVAGAIAIAAMDTYAFITSSAATLATLAAAGGVATFKGGKWLVYELPRKLFFYPVSATLETDVPYEREEETAERVTDLLGKLELPGLKNLRAEAEIGKYKSKIVLTGQTPDGKDLKAAVVQVSIKKTKVRLRLEISRKYYKLRRGLENLGRKEARRLLTSEATEILAGLEKAVETEETPATPALAIP